MKATRLLACYDRESRRFHNYYTIFFDCTTVDKVQDANTLEISEVDFFPVEELPPLVIEDGDQQIARLFELHLNPALAPDFD